MTTDTVAVLGLGPLGSGLAAAGAAAGLSVLVLEQDEARLAAGRASLPSGISATARPADLARCTVVIDAVTEAEAHKAELLAGVAAVVSDDAILATATSTVPVTRLASALPHPERCGGLHFLDPAGRSPLVEVVRALQTSDDTAARLVGLVTRLGRHPIVVEDRPGYLVHALLLPYLNQAIRELDEGLAEPADLDRAVELGLGYPDGPLRTLDRIGLDTHLALTEALYAATRDVRYAPPPRLTRMVAAGRLGEKSGHGFVTGGAP